MKGMKGIFFIPFILFFVPVEIAFCLRVGDEEVLPRICADDADKSPIRVRRVRSVPPALAGGSAPETKST